MARSRPLPPQNQPTLAQELEQNHAEQTFLYEILGFSRHCTEKNN